MRLDEIIDNEDFEILRKKIETDASEYTSSYSNWKTAPLYRGFDNNVETFQILRTPTNRTPEDSPLNYQKLIDKIYTEIGVVAKRSNSIFCSFSKGTTEFYSDNTSVIIPMNGYHASQITSIKDLYMSLDTFFVKGLLDIADKDAKVFMRSDLYRVMEKLAGPKYSSAEFAELTSHFVDLNKISFNDIVDIIKNLYKYTNVTKALKEFYSLLDDAHVWNKIITNAGVKDTGLGNIIKADIVTDFNKMNKRNEVIVGDCFYMAVNLPFWKKFIKYIDT